MGQSRFVIDQLYYNVKILAGYK